MYPDKFLNITNGVTTRRWISICNKAMSNLITDTLNSDSWIKDTMKLEGRTISLSIRLLSSELRQYAYNSEFQRKWRLVKQKNKERLAAYIQKEFGVSIPVSALFDIQVKRLHEYKRQFLNILSVVWRWKQISAMTMEQRADGTPSSHSI